MKNNQSTRRGFTLIELLVVVLIIGILAAVAVPQYQKAVEKSRIAEARVMLNAIYQAYQVRVLRDGLPPNEAQGWEDLFSKMDIELPGEIQTCFNDDPECVDSKYWRYHNEGSLAIFAERLDGKFDNDAGQYPYTLVLDLATGEIACGNEQGTTCTDLYGENPHVLN